MLSAHRLQPATNEPDHATDSPAQPAPTRLPPAPPLPGPPAAQPAQSQRPPAAAPATPGAGNSRSAGGGRAASGQGKRTRQPKKRHAGLRAANACASSSQPEPGTGRTTSFIRRAVPSSLHWQFSSVVASVLEQIVAASAAARGGNALDQVLTPFATLLRLPAKLLAEPRGGRHEAKRNKRMMSRMDMFARGVLEDEPECQEPEKRPTQGVVLLLDCRTSYICVTRLLSAQYGS
eukprot:jgi/Ulvmu1/9233/UM005_0333.1